MQTSAAAAIIRRRRAMIVLAANVPGWLCWLRGRQPRASGAAQRCLTRPRAALQLGRALSATGQARLLEQSELARWKLGFGNGFFERCVRQAVTVWARVKRLVQLGVDDAGSTRTISFEALDVPTLGLWSVYDSSGLPVHASVRVGQIGSAGSREPRSW